MATAIPRRRGTATPVLGQVEDADCGAACLGILLAHRGVAVPAAQLRAECRVGRDGASAADLLRAAARHGMAGRGARVRAADSADLSTGLRRFDLPAIVLLGRGHFVVVESVRANGSVDVNDPGRGRHVMPAAAFAAEFGGVVLAFQPGTGGVRRSPSTSGPPGWARRVRAWLRPVSGLVVMAVLAGATSGALLASAVALVAGSSTVLLRPGAGLSSAVLVAAAVLVGGTAWGQRRLLSAVLDRTAGRLAREVVEALLTAPAAVIARRPTAGLLAQVHLADVAAVLLAHRIVPLLAGVALLVPLLAVLGVLAPATTAAATAGVLIAGLLRLVGDRRSAPARRLVASELGRRDAIARAALGRGATVAAEGSDEDLFAELTDLHERDLVARDDVARRQAPWHAAATAVELTAIPTVCALLSAGAASPATLLALYPMLGAARTVADLARELPEFVGRLSILDDLTGLPSLPRYRTQARGPARQGPGRVELHDVTFGYTPGRPPLLQGLDLTVPAGTRMVLRGAAGSGRSTLLRLLAGAVEPNTGRVLLDGHRHTDLPREVLRASIGLLPATPRLFPGSVADNVTLFDDDIDDAALDAALDDSGLTDVVAGRGGPRKAVVTQGGRNFAGGERQRLALARALVRRPSVLLLDDPTKGLDPQLRARIDTMLRRRGATTVMATDLPSAARRDDLVLTLHDGRLRPVEVAR